MRQEYCARQVFTGSAANQLCGVRKVSVLRASSANTIRGRRARLNTDAPGGHVSKLFPGDGNVQVKATEYSAVHVGR